MAKVWCAAIECTNNKDNMCTAAEINLTEGHIHTVHQGFKQVWGCRTYNVTDQYKQLEDSIKEFYRTYGERKGDGNA